MAATTVKILSVNISAWNRFKASLENLNPDIIMLQETRLDAKGQLGPSKVARQSGYDSFFGLPARQQRGQNGKMVRLAQGGIATLVRSGRATGIEWTSMGSSEGIACYFTLDAYGTSLQ